MENNILKKIQLHLDTLPAITTENETTDEEIQEYNSELNKLLAENNITLEEYFKFLLSQTR